jgi:hypothetical protein
MEHDTNEILMICSKPNSNKNIGEITYTCLIHPEVISDKPGKCPKCGNDLVIKY